MFSANQTPSNSQKDTVRNVEATGKFIWNLATYELREEVNRSAVQEEYGVDEFEKAGVEKEDSKLSGVVVVGNSGEGRKEMMIPMVMRSPVKFECEYYTTSADPIGGFPGSRNVV